MSFALGYALGFPRMQGIQLVLILGALRQNPLGTRQQFIQAHMGTPLHLFLLTVDAAQNERVSRL